MTPPSKAESPEELSIYEIITSWCGKSHNKGKHRKSPQLVMLRAGIWGRGEETSQVWSQGWAF